MINMSNIRTLTTTTTKQLQQHESASKSRFFLGNRINDYERSVIISHMYTILIFEKTVKYQLLDINVK